MTFWGLTAQNEPIDGNIPNFSFNCMGWNATTQADFVADFLGPALDGAGYGDLELMVFDDQRPYVAPWVDTVLENPANEGYVAGIAVHWYIDDIVDIVHSLDEVHDRHPDKFILYSEACTGMGTYGKQYVHYDNITSRNNKQQLLQ